MYTDRIYLIKSSTLRKDLNYDFNCSCSYVAVILHKAIEVSSSYPLEFKIEFQHDVTELVL
jgi:hypothetical protein